MKNTAFCFMLIVVVVSTLPGCKKSAAPPSVNNKLTVSKSAVLVNQPDTVQLAGVNAGDNIKWDVSPVGTSYLVTRSSGAMIVFTKAGNYTINATDNGATPVTGSVSVTDSVAHAGTQYTITPFTGDQITLVPYFYKSTTADSSYLKFVAQTKNSYCEQSDMHIAYSFDNGNYNIGFLDVVEPSPCPLGDGSLGWEIDFTASATGPLADGTFPLSVTLNGTTYTGSIVVTPANITFNWNYTSGVLISPKLLNR